jgi:transposase
MRRGLFWFNDAQWRRISPHLPTNLRGPARDDDRRIVSGIVHMLQSGARWRDCPPEYGPYTTIYNRFNRWAKAGRWEAIFAAMAKGGKDAVTLSLDSTSIKAHRSASGGKGGAHAGDRPLARRTHHENPRAERSALPALRDPSDARPGRRHHCGARCFGARAADARSARRQRL